MTREDRDFFRGWQAADRNHPFEIHETPAWKEGYQHFLNSVELRRSLKGKYGTLRIPLPQRHQHERGAHV